MSKLKVTVTGFINEVFVGNDKQVEEYLNKIKKIQESNLDIKEYRKEMPPFKMSMLHRGGSGMSYQYYVNKYHDPTYTLKQFREKSKPYGLKIKIETIKNDFF